MIRVESIPAVRHGLEQLQSDSRGHGELAERLIMKSVWWYDHPNGKVRAPKHGERITTGRYGLELSFGANRFLIGKAILDCASRLDGFLKEVASSPASIDAFKLKQILVVILAPVLRSCVADYGDAIYACYGNSEDDYMHFGVQAINVKEFVDEFLMVCELQAVWT